MKSLSWSLLTTILCCLVLVNARAGVIAIQHVGRDNRRDSLEGLQFLRHDPRISTLSRSYPGRSTTTGLFHLVKGNPQRIGSRTIANRDEDANASEISPMGPVITPALSVAGVVLILSGLVFASIGTKNVSIQVFFSIAYLVGLAATVLVLFLINPPISYAIQGAYFVAIFVSAVLAGSLSLVFKDMLEGMSAAIGGFSWAMFLLVIHDGGLLQSSITKAVFIACWIVGFYGLQFVRQIRTYINIFSTSLSGATAIILGIDCFSRAGLKEFWAYLWNLNDKLYPDNSPTYLITRGMIVEIVGIGLLTAIGVLSQVRVWKLIKEQKEIRDRIKRNERHQREDLEAELGRIIEETQSRERYKWEQSQSDNSLAVTSSDEMKRSISFNSTAENSENEALELKVSRPSRVQHGQNKDPRHAHMHVVTVTNDDITPVSSANGSQHQIQSFNSSTSLLKLEQSSHLERNIANPVTVPLTATIRPSDQLSEDSVCSTGPVDRGHESEKSSSGGPGSRGFGNGWKRLRASLRKSAGTRSQKTETTQAPAFYLPVLDTGSRFDALVAGKDPIDRVLSTTSSKQNSSIALVDHPNIQLGGRSDINTGTSHVDESKLFIETQPNAIPDKKTQDETSTYNISINDRLSTGTPASLMAQDQEERPVLENSRKDIKALDLPLSSYYPFDPQFETDLASGPNDSTQLPQHEFISTVNSFTQNDSKESSTSAGKRYASAHQKDETHRQQTREWDDQPSATEDVGFEEDTTPRTSNKMPAPIVDEAHWLRRPATDQSLTSFPKFREQDTIVPRIPAKAMTSSQYRSIPARTPEVEQLRRTIPRVSSGSSLTSTAGSLPRHSDSRRHSQRQLRSSMQNNPRSVLASPIDEDSEASFFEEPLPIDMSLARRASYPSQSLSHSSLTPQPRSRQSWSTIQRRSTKPSISATPDEGLSLAARREQLRRMSSQTYEGPDSFPTPPRSDTSSPQSYQMFSSSSTQQRQAPIKSSSNQYSVPEHTIRRASMLAEWRRTNSLDQLNHERHSPKPERQLSTPLTSFRASDSIDQARPPSRGYNTSSVSRYLQGTPIGNHGMISSSIYGGQSKSDNRPDRPSNRTQARYSSPVTTIPTMASRVPKSVPPRDMDNAHREALRRMQAGADRALRNSYTYREDTNHLILAYK